VCAIKSIESLTQACKSSKAHDDIVACWSTAAAWLENVSNHFREIVNDLDPVALLVMAYWFAIMDLRIEGLNCWFLKGVAKASVLQAAERLVADKRLLLLLILDFGSF
jgi:hypothetical protein